jgi:hypothetical protein
MPTTANVSANPVLTATLNNYLVNAEGFVGRRVAPFFLTPEQSAQYYVFDRTNMLSSPSLKGRAPSTPFPRTALKLSDDTYRTIDRGLECPVDDGQRKKYAKAFDADAAAIRKIRNDVLINHEQRVVAAATVSAVANHTPTKRWDEYTETASDPVADVDTGKNAIFNATGMEANLLVIPRAVFYKLKEHPKILDKIKYSQRGVVTREILAEVFGVDEILVPGLVTNSAAEGQTPVPAGLWGKIGFLCHAENVQSLDAPNFMRTFVWTAETGADGVLVESYREDTIKSDVHRAQHWTDEKRVGLELGYQIKAVIA